MGFFFFWRLGVNLKTIDQRVFSATPRFRASASHGPTANQKSDVRAPHTVMPTSNTAQSKGVNPNNLPSLITCVIAGYSSLDPD
jgi:hypothetical protein